MRRLLALPAVVAVLLLLGGCSSTVSLRPAAEATSVGCAGVIVRLPETIGSQTRRSTDAQGTAAWGVPTVVTLTCGVRTPSATTTTCLTIDGVDWLLEEQKIDGVDAQVATTFGRSPGTQVILTDSGAVSVDTILNAVSDPVAAATKKTSVRCLS